MLLGFGPQPEHTADNRRLLSQGDTYKPVVCDLLEKLKFKA